MASAKHGPAHLHHDAGTAGEHGLDEDPEDVIGKGQRQQYASHLW